jgi:hypothetical protein
MSQRNLESGPLEALMEAGKSDHIKTASRSDGSEALTKPNCPLSPNKPSTGEVPLTGIPDSPVRRITLGMRVGLHIYVISCIGVTFLVTQLIPGIPEPVFWLILPGVIIFGLLAKGLLYTTRFQLDSKTVVYGPPWARRSRAFETVMAVQLLDVLRAAREKTKEPARMIEVNLVFQSLHRISIAIHKDKAKARNIASSVADIFRVPIIEQLYVKTL